MRTTHFRRAAMSQTRIICIGDVKGSVKSNHCALRVGGLAAEVANSRCVYVQIRACVRIRADPDKSVQANFLSLLGEESGAEPTIRGAGSGQVGKGSGVAQV